MTLGQATLMVTRFLKLRVKHLAAEDNFQSVKLQRTDRVTVCSHFAMDTTAKVRVTLYFFPISGLVKIAYARRYVVFEEYFGKT